MSHTVISQICLAYLLQFDTSEPLDINVDACFPLAKYAAQHWILHSQFGSKTESQSSSVFALMMKLLTKENMAFVSWVQLCDVDDSDCLNLQKEKAKIAKPLYYTIIAGLTEAAYALLDMEVDVNGQGGKYGTALQAASYKGHEAIAKLLVEKGADINAQGGEYGNALQAASHKGHEAIAKLLIKKGADVNAQGGYYRDASYQGHEAIAKLLMQKGVLQSPTNC